MNDLDRVFAAASAVCQEATRRWFGDPHDSRFDVPLAMMLDLQETLEGREALGADFPEPASTESREASQPPTGRLAAAEGAS